MRVLALAVAALCLLAVPASAECAFKFQCSNTFKSGPKTYPVVNTYNQRQGDVYDPGHNRRLQIRDNQRVIHGYIERDGTITNTSRQKVLTIEGLRAR